MTNGSDGRVALRTIGGFAHLPGLAKEWSTSLADLDPADRRAITTAVADADFFGRPDFTRSDAVRDAREHHLSMELGGRRRSMVLHEPLRDEALAELVGVIRAIRARRSGAG